MDDSRMLFWVWAGMLLANLVLFAWLLWLVDRTRQTLLALQIQRRKADAVYDLLVNTIAPELGIKLQISVAELPDGVKVSTQTVREGEQFGLPRPRGLFE